MSTPTQTQPDSPTMANAHPRWARPGLLACIAAVVIAYGSLIPFDMAWSASVQRHGVWGALAEALTAPRWAPAGPGRSALGVPFAVSDVITNLLLYAPLGVTLRMALRARRRSLPYELLGTLLIVLALSWFVESMQSLMPMRVASLNDVAANSGAALLSALLAPWLWGIYKRLAFACYCRLSPTIGWLRRVRDRPGVAMAIAAGNALVIGLWYAIELRRAGQPDPGAGQPALPFERAFRLPYDLGAVLLGRALLVYAGLGCLLLLTYTGRRRLAMGWVVLGVALLALGAELSRAATHNALPDITGPLLALAAGALMTITLYTFSLGVKRSNRRRQAAKYDGPDRRREPHEYA